MDPTVKLTLVENRISKRLDALCADVQLLSAKADKLLAFLEKNGLPKPETNHDEHNNDLDEKGRPKIGTLLHELYSRISKRVAPPTLVSLANDLERPNNFEQVGREKVQKLIYKYSSGKNKLFSLKRGGRGGIYLTIHR